MLRAWSYQSSPIDPETIGSRSSNSLSARSDSTKPAIAVTAVRSSASSVTCWLLRWRIS